jgi:hypothetical protein
MSAHHDISSEAMQRWLDNQLKQPPDSPYNKGYNDAILDMQNALKASIVTADKRDHADNS